MEQQIKQAENNNSQNKFTKNIQIIDLQINDIISDLFVVKSKSNIEQYSNNSKYRFTLQLTDKTGTIDAKYWGSENEEEVTNLWQSLKSGDVVHIAAKVQEYQGTMELNINNNTLTKLNQDQYNANFFLEESTKDLGQLYQYLQTTINQITNPELKLLCNQFYQEPIFQKQLMQSPATMLYHHAYLGGLLEHIHAMAQHAIHLTNIYSKLDKDLLITATLLCNIGKIQYLKTSTTIELTDQGHLLGDMLLTYQMLQGKLSASQISEQTKLKLLNCIASQLGKKSRGSPKRPATPEALALAQIKELDSNLSLMIKLKEQAKEANQGDSLIYTKEFGNIYLI